MRKGQDDVAAAIRNRVTPIPPGPRPTSLHLPGNVLANLFVVAGLMYGVASLATWAYHQLYPRVPVRSADAGLAIRATTNKDIGWEQTIVETTGGAYGTYYAVDGVIKVNKGQHLTFKTSLMNLKDNWLCKADSDACFPIVGTHPSAP